ncbi:GGDEF domain-containing protein, partial [candidate division KSB1 bacterium]
EHRKPHIYSERHERILVMLANNFSVALERCHALTQLESLATTDGLTQLYNYRSFSIRLSEEIERSLRYKLKFSLLMLDLDHFKNVNDTYGHLAGDLVLKKVAEEIKLSTRAIDFIARYGGEEFAVILIESDIEDALVIAGRIRKNIESLKMTYNDEIVSITISIGGVEFRGSPRIPQELIERADKALYKAKMNGRNRIETYQEKEAESVVNDNP